MKVYASEKEKKIYASEKPGTCHQQHKVTPPKLYQFTTKRKRSSYSSLHGIQEKEQHHLESEQMHPKLGT